MSLHETVVFTLDPSLCEPVCLTPGLTCVGLRLWVWLLLGDHGFDSCIWDCRARWLSLCESV